jgi:hypothetical protein
MALSAGARPRPVNRVADSGISVVAIMRLRGVIHSAATLLPFRYGLLALVLSPAYAERRGCGRKRSALTVIETRLGFRPLRIMAAVF